MTKQLTLFTQDDYEIKEREVLCQEVLSLSRAIMFNTGNLMVIGLVFFFA